MAEKEDVLSFYIVFPHSNMKHFAMAALLVATVFVAGCDNLTEPPVALALRSDDGVELLVSDETIASYFKDVTVPVSGAPGRTMRATFDTYRLMVGNEHTYLIGEGQTEDGACYILARELRVDGNRFGPIDDGEMFIPPTHSCQGNPCSNCAFTTRGGAIVGCACVGSGSDGNMGHCDHTIST